MPKGRPKVKARTDNWLIVIVGVMAAIIAVWLGVLYPSPTQDTMCRYAVMAECFAEGKWFESFHPRFCVLFPVLTGITVKIFDINSLFACCAVAMMGWALGIFPLFRIARNVFDTKCAWFALALYMVCPQIIFWGFQGLRETWRMFALLMMVAALFEKKEAHVTALLEMMVGVMISMTLRVDAIAVALLMMFVYFVRECFSWRSWVVFAWGVWWVQPCCYLNYVWLGMWIPSPQFIPFFWKWIA